MLRRSVGFAESHSLHICMLCDRVESLIVWAGYTASNGL